MANNISFKKPNSSKIKFSFSKKTFSYPYIVFMLLFVVVPSVILLCNAFISDTTNHLTLSNFSDFFLDGSGLNVLFISLIVGVVTTIFCLLIGYPVAYFLVKYNFNKIFVLLFTLPMWINFLIRTLATKALFMHFEIELGIGTVLFGMVYNYLPFMILPIHTSISSIDKSYIESAQDLGANGVETFLRTTLPLSFPGILSGITMVFIPTISTFAISQLLSDGMIYLFGDSIQTKFDQGLFGVGSVMSLVMLVMVIISSLLLNKLGNKNTGRTTTI